ncbi:MAG: hypothetical protein B6245_23905 [Desulfobacteraceae bacterium 4572_88]|nr:MAG: hypothetical protein B6245_23905 [Desulfobacteraceae bacterium 4572_88]
MPHIFIKYDIPLQSEEAYPRNSRISRWKIAFIPVPRNWKIPWKCLGFGNSRRIGRGNFHLLRIFSGSFHDYPR